MTQRRYSAKHGQSGSVLMVLLLFLPLLIAMGGIGADIGKLYVAKSELQNAADACALAGAAQFDGQSDQNTRATNVATTIALKNKTLFQKDTLTASAVQVSFPGSMNGVAGQYITCNVSKSGITNWITPVINRVGGAVNASETISATATATTRPSQTSCAIPIGVCQADLTGKKAGDWLQGVIGPSGTSSNNGNGNGNGNGSNSNSTDSSIQSGNFKWVNLNSSSNSANDLSDQLSGAQSTNCSSTPTVKGQSIGVSGFKASLREDFNTRFGIIKGTSTSTNYPDVSGKGYYDPLVTSRYKNDYSTAAAPAHTPYTAISGIDIKTNGNGNYQFMTQQQLTTFGTNRRVVIAPVVNCTNMTLQSFACIFLLHPLSTSNTTNFNMYLEYLGDTSSSTTPCKTGGFVGSTSVGPRIAALVQ